MKIRPTSLVSTSLVSTFVASAAVRTLRAATLCLAICCLTAGCSTTLGTAGSGVFGLFDGRYTSDRAVRKAAAEDPFPDAGSVLSASSKSNTANAE